MIPSPFWSWGLGLVAIALIPCCSVRSLNWIQVVCECQVSWSISISRLVSLKSYTMVSCLACERRPLTLRVAKKRLEDAERC